MTPKEKAVELVEYFQAILESPLTKGLFWKEAKQCALIAVEFAKDNPLNTDGYNKYLDQVKEEIEKL